MSMNPERSAGLKNTFRRECLTTASTSSYGDTSTTAESNLKRSQASRISSLNPDHQSPRHYRMASRYRSIYPVKSSGATPSLTTISHFRQVAFLEIQGKEFQMTPIPLRTVRPFVMEELIMSEEAEEHGFSLTDKMEINKFLRSRVRCDPGILGAAVLRPGFRSVGRGFDSTRCYRIRRTAERTCRRGRRGRRHPPTQGNAPVGSLEGRHHGCSRDEQSHSLRSRVSRKSGQSKGSSGVYETEKIGTEGSVWLRPCQSRLTKLRLSCQNRQARTVHRRSRPLHPKQAGPCSFCSTS